MWQSKMRSGLGTKSAASAQHVCFERAFTIQCTYLPVSVFQQGLTQAWHSGASNFSKKQDHWNREWVSLSYSLHLQDEHNHIVWIKQQFQKQCSSWWVPQNAKWYTSSSQTRLLCMCIQNALWNLKMILLNIYRQKCTLSIIPASIKILNPISILPHMIIFKKPYRDAYGTGYGTE